eukprot:scaffold1583_cov105-Isochrysis_galbana.AAC.4
MARNGSGPGYKRASSGAGSTDSAKLIHFCLLRSEDLEICSVADSQDRPTSSADAKRRAPNPIAELHRVIDS